MNNKIIQLCAIISVVASIASVSAILYYDGMVEPQFTDNNSMLDKTKIVDWRHVHGLGLDPTDSSLLYIATHGDFYQSISGAPPVKVDKIRADYMAFNAPKISGYPLYASGHPNTGGNTGLIKSNDGGINWKHVSDVIQPPVDFHAMAVGTQNPDMLIGFDSGARGLFKTIDAGKTWETLQGPPFEYISALAISPDNSDLIIAGTGNGIYKSEDGGHTWLKLSAYPKLAVYALDFDSQGVLFASIKTKGIVSSFDLEEWQSMIHIDLTVLNLTADSKNAQIYLSGFTSNGYQEVYKMTYDGNFYELIGTNKGL